MNDLLRLIWPAVEAVHPVFSRAAIVRWPRGAHAQLVAAKLIMPGGTAGRIRCPECGKDHAATPMMRVQPDGATRVFIACPDHGRADITQLDRQQWTVHIEALAGIIARELALTGKPTDLAGGRVWRCGRTKVSGKSRDVLFARGLCRQDAGQFRRAITSAHQPIVFVGSQLPPGDFWHGTAPMLIRLCDVATFDGASFTLDTAHIMGVITQPAASPIVPGITVDEKKLKTLIRQQVKADKKTALTDDILAAAYRQEQSFDKAAAFLNANPEVTERVTRDRVRYAVIRKGGIAAVISGANSDSVMRPVASHRRDTRGKILLEAQADDSAEVTED